MKPSLLRATPEQGVLALAFGLALGPVAHAIAYGALDVVRASLGPDLPPPSDVLSAFVTIGIVGQLTGAAIVVTGLVAYRPDAGDHWPTLLALGVLRAVAVIGLWLAATDDRFHLWSVALGLALPDAVFVAVLLRHVAAQRTGTRLGSLAGTMAPAYVLYKVIWASFVFFPREMQADAHLVHRVLSLVMTAIIVALVVQLRRRPQTHVSGQAGG